MSNKIISKPQDYENWQAPSVAQQKKPAELEITVEQITAIKNQARREGFNQGYREGKATGEKFMRQKADMFQAFMDTLAAPMRDMDERVEQELLQLSIAIARQIIRREIQTDKGQIMAVIRDAIKALPVAARHVKLVLHPDDAAFVNEVMPRQDEQTRFDILDDPTLNRGDCRLLADSSEIDATVETRLTTIAARLLAGSREADGAD